MFHLFNSLYVEVDREIDDEQNRAVISEQMGMPFLKLEGQESVVEPAVVAGSLEELGQPGFEDLLQQLAELEPVYLYADEATYIRLWASLVFAYMPSVDYETFRYLFLCKKSILNCRTTTTMRERQTEINPVTITGPKVEAAFAQAPTDWVTETLVQWLSKPAVVRSLEWDILGLRLGNPLKDEGLRLRYLIDRVLLTNVPDTMGYLSTFMGNPAQWALIGADLDTLLNEETVFQGCYNFKYLNNADFVMLSNINDRYPIDWLAEMIEEMLFLLRHNNDLSIVAYMESIHEVYKSGFIVSDYQDLFKLLHRFFDHGPKMVRVSQRDIGKYDDNLLRFVINAPLGTLTRAGIGAKWLD